MRRSPSAWVKCITFGSSIALWAIETHENIPSAFRGLRILPTGTFPCAVTALQELRQYHHHLLSINPPVSEIVYYFFSWAFYICSLFSCTCPQLPKNKLVSFFISFHCSQSLCPLQIPPILSSSGTTLACGFGEEGFVWSFNAWQNSLIDFLGNWNLFFYLQNRESLTLQASSWCPGSLLQFQFGVTVFLEGKSSANAMLILSHCWGWSMKQLYFLVMWASVCFKLTGNHSHIGLLGHQVRMRRNQDSDNEYRPDLSPQHSWRSSQPTFKQLKYLIPS